MRGTLRTLLCIGASITAFGCHGAGVRGRARRDGGGDLAKEQQTKLIMGVVAQSAQIYRIHCGELPPPKPGLTALLAKGDGCPKWTGPYLRAEDRNDAWGKALRYSQKAGVLDLVSAGSDGKFGTADDVVYSKVQTGEFAKGRARSGDGAKRPMALKGGAKQEHAAVAKSVMGACEQILGGRTCIEYRVANEADLAAPKGVCDSLSTGPMKAMGASSKWLPRCDRKGAVGECAVRSEIHVSYPIPEGADESLKHAVTKCAVFKGVWKRNPKFAASIKEADIDTKAELATYAKKIKDMSAPTKGQMSAIMQGTLEGSCRTFHKGKMVECETARLMSEFTRKNRETVCSAFNGKAADLPEVKKTWQPDTPCPTKAVLGVCTHKSYVTDDTVKVWYSAFLGDYSGKSDPAQARASLEERCTKIFKGTWSTP